MRKLITVLGVFCLILGCSKDELNCTEKKQEINATYSIAVSRDGITTEQKEELYAQWQRELDQACD